MNARTTLLLVLMVFLGSGCKGKVVIPSAEDETATDCVGDDCPSEVTCTPLAIGGSCPEQSSCITGACYGDGDVVPIEIPDGEVRLQTTDAEFVAAIRDGTPVAPDFADGVGYMTFCEAVALSCHRGHAVDLAGLQPAMTAWGEPL